MGRQTLAALREGSDGRVAAGVRERDPAQEGVAGLDRDYT